VLQAILFDFDETLTDRVPSSTMRNDFETILLTTWHQRLAISLTSVRPWPPDHPESSWQIAALEELVERVHSEQKPAT
jgi:hypothetical protein